MQIKTQQLLHNIDPIEVLYQTSRKLPEYCSNLEFLMSRGGGRDVVKVKIINTEYVYTDPMSFKSVVQRLTGKDAVVTKAEGSSGRCNTAGTAYAGGGFERTRDVAVPSRELLSQEDFDRMMKQMPSVDEMLRLWGDS